MQFDFFVEWVQEIEVIRIVLLIVCSWILSNYRKSTKKDKKKCKKVQKSAKMANNVKIVIVGDGSVGKTSLCNVFVNQSFPQNHDATVFENYSQELYVCGQVWLILF